MMTKLVVCWEMFKTLWKESIKFQWFGWFSPILDSFTWRWHSWRMLVSFTLVDNHGGNLDAQMTFPFPNETKKLYIMLHLEINDHDNTWLFGKNLIMIFYKRRRFQILDMGECIQLNPIMKSCSSHLKWQLGWSLIAHVLTLFLC